MRYLKHFIAKIKLRIAHNRCYNAKERCGIAVFSMCKGHYHEGGIPYEGCSGCPYFVDIRSSENEKTKNNTPGS